ncbi:SIP domain-containing protein [Streptomyces sp. NPDC056049]|uniref:SIP domain-containing protein n=1 Tax=Streptomyces sp. NPDC056049 TaxID=3345693 RepID=UPI0035DCE59B
MVSRLPTIDPRHARGSVAHVLIACEASAVRTARTYLPDDRMLPRPRVTTRGYWRVGAADHPTTTTARTDGPAKLSRTTGSRSSRTSGGVSMRGRGGP